MSCGNCGSDILVLSGGGGGGDVFVSGASMVNGNLVLTRSGASDLVVADILNNATDSDGDTRLELVEGANDSINFVVDGNIVMTLSSTKMTLNSIFIDPPTGMELVPQATNPAPAGSDPDNVIWVNSSNGHLYRGSLDLEMVGSVAAAADVSVAPISGLTATDVQAALAEHQADIDALSGGGSPTSADMISFTPFGFVSSTDVQDGMEQIITNATAMSGDIASLMASSHDPVTLGVVPSGMIINASQEISLSLTGNDIGITPTSPLTGTNSQSLFSEVAGILTTIDGAISSLASLSHEPLVLGSVPSGITLSPSQVLSISLDAADISNTPSGNLTSINVQSALYELQSDIDALSGGGGGGGGIIDPSNIGTHTVYPSQLNLNSTLVVDGGTNSLNIFNTSLSRVASNGFVDLAGLSIRAYGSTLSLRDIAVSPMQAPHLNLYEANANGSHFTTLRARDLLSSNTLFVLPDSNGSVGQVLKTNGSGFTYWDTESGLSMGIDDVLSVNQPLSVNRTIRLNGNTFQLFDVDGGGSPLGSFTFLNNGRFTFTANGNAVSGETSTINLNGNALNLNMAGTKAYIQIADNPSFTLGRFLITFGARWSRFLPADGQPTHPIRLYNSSGHYVGLQGRAGASSGNSHDYSLPETQGLAGQQLENDGFGNLFWDTASDERIKENVAYVTNAVEIVMAIKLRQYNFIGEPNRVQYGFIAQEVYQVAPQLVGKRSGNTPWRDGSINDLMTLDKSSLVALLFGAVQDQENRLRKLEG